jgi:tonB family C-terminal domain
MRRIILFVLFCVSSVDAGAQFIVCSNKALRGYRYAETHVEGMFGDGKYYGLLSDFTVLYDDNDMKYVIYAGCGDEWSLTAYVKHEHVKDGVHYYKGYCQKVIDTVQEDGSPVSLNDVSDVSVAVSVPLSGFADCLGMSRDSAMRKYAGRKRFSDEHFAITMFVGQQALVFVPIADNIDGCLVEYENCLFPPVSEDRGMLISDISSGLYSNYRIRLCDAVNAVTEGFCGNGIALDITDSLSVDASGVASHNLYVSQFITEYPELQDRVLDTLRKIQFGPVSVKKYDSDEKLVVPCYDVFELSFRNGFVQPKFNGGDINKFSQWVNSRLIYPDECKKNNIQGRVVLRFTVSENGKVTDVKVLKSVHPLLDAEAVRIVRLSPKWKPGEVLGSKVSLYYTFPVIFGLYRIN